jgi:alpha-1,2-mannosyltransferase
MPGTPRGGSPGAGGIPSAVVSAVPPDCRTAPARPEGLAVRVLAGLVVVASLAVTAVLHVGHPGTLVGLLPSPDMRELHVDFDTFWHSAAALTHGADIYDTPAKLTNLNPPLLTVLLTPFTLLDALPGYRVFAVLTLLMVLGAVLVVARELRLGRGVTVAVVLAVLASSPLHGTLVLGQIYGLLLIGLVAGWVAERRGRPVAAAVLWGITVALKPSLGPVLLLGLALRRWRPLRAGLAAGAVASLTGVLVAGPASGPQWLVIALSEPVPDAVDNASLPGVAMRLDIPPAVGTVLGAVLLLGTLLWLARHRARVDPAGTAPWAVVAAGLLVAPIAWHNYLLLLLPGVLVLLAQGRRVTAAALLALPLVPVAWNAVWLPEVPGAELARSLYCAILVGHWLALLHAARTAPPHPPSPSAARVCDVAANPA